MSGKKTALLIHGCHVEARGWERIVWGDPHGLLGRVPKGIFEAFIHGAELVIWGTGASSKDGKPESKYTYDYALQRLDELAVLPIGGVKYTVEDLRDKVTQVSFLDTVTQNTTEEIRAAIGLCVERDISELYLVSSPTHVARCMQEALKVLAERGNKHDLRVYATASDTCFEGSTPESVVIVEPPHRGDLPLWQTYRYTKSMFGIMRGGDDIFERYLEDWGALLAEYSIKINWPPKI